METRILPLTPAGRWALGLAAAVVFYPLYWSILLVLPPNVGRFAGVALLAVAVAALVTGGVALLRHHDRSILLIAALSLMVLGSLAFLGGEFLLPH